MLISEKSPPKRHPLDLTKQCRRNVTACNALFMPVIRGHDLHIFSNKVSLSSAYFSRSRQLHASQGNISSDDNPTKRGVQTAADL
jgi:hypothetical protein